ncbi:BPI fold-containing family B member 2 [Pogoniulus pusillus]|uniref:BPI fold-containing family B member 2 n=1 Tax=Pogoniulus pusillus TaxID=488313 RepID=UPI0030B92430
MGRVNKTKGPAGGPAASPLPAPAPPARVQKAAAALGSPRQEEAELQDGQAQQHRYSCARKLGSRGGLAPAARGGSAGLAPTAGGLAEVPTWLAGCPASSQRDSDSTGAEAAKLCTLSVLLSLLAPAQPNRSPDCGGILTPSGLSYFAEVSKPHTEAVLRQQLVADSDLFVSPSKPSRNQVTSVNVSRLALSLVPHAGLRLSIDADLGISSALSPSRVVKLSILADLHVEMNLEGNMELVTSSCKPTVEGTGSSTEEVESNSSSAELDKEINVGKICLEVTRLLLSPNERLFSLTTQFPVTPSCQVQYVPLAVPMFSEQGIIISLQTTFQVAGIPIPLPVSPVPFSMPEPASSSPSHLTLAFSEHFYTSLFFALEIAGAFNMTLLSPLTTNTLAQKIPQMASLFQEDVPVILQAVFRSTPRVELEEGKAALKLFLTVHIGASPAAFQSFLSLSVDMSAGLLLSVVDMKMKITAATIEGTELSLAASDVGSVPDAVLEEMFLPTVRQEVPAQLNAVLSEGIFLPHISGFTYTDVRVVTHRDYVLVPCNLQLQERIGERSHSR